MKKSGLVYWVLFCMNSVHAADLIEVYQEALHNDTEFRQAYDAYMSSTEMIPQARAALYPQVAINSLIARTIQDASGGGNFINNGSTPLGGFGNTTYNGNQWQVIASQAIFNYKAWSQVQKAKASVKAAQATFNNAAQNLILRTAKAYFDLLLAKDTLNFAEAKKRANKKQFDQASQRFDVGLDTITSVYEAKAAYDQSIATVISAKNNQINQNENLRKLINRVYENIDPLKNNQVPLVRPQPNDVDEWIDTGLKQNYKLLSAKYSLDAAKDNVRSLSSGNWPVFSIQSSATQNHNDVDINSYFAPAKQTQANIALAMNFPIFQGGLVQSKTRQAQYDFQASSEQLEQAYRDVVVNSRIAFNTINDGISKVKADRQTIVSQKNSLESTEAQFEAGTRTMVDVVNAQQKLFEAQEQLASDQYNLIYSILTLKYLAGTLNVNDLEQVNSWLATNRVNGYTQDKKAPSK